MTAAGAAKQLRYNLPPNVIQDIVRRVVAAARPKEIILFGSAARGTMGPNSDVDLLVIKRGRFNRARVENAIYRGLRGCGAAVDVIVVTPEEIERYRASPCLVIHPACATGRLCMTSKRLPPTDPREWLRRAQLNLARSRNVLPAADFEDYCFDAQQAAEKAIKAVFILHGAAFQYVHDLGRLLTDLATTGVSVPKYLLPADQLTRYAVMARYPGLSSPVTKSQYARAVRIAERVVNWAERQIRKQLP